MEDFFFLIRGETEAHTESYRYRKETRERTGSGYFRYAVRVRCLTLEQAKKILFRIGETVNAVADDYPDWKLAVNIIPIEGLNENMLLNLLGVENVLEYDWQWEGSGSHYPLPGIMEAGKRDIAWRIVENAKLVKRLKSVQTPDSGPGRPRSPRTQWIIEQYAKGLKPAQIRNLWEAGGEKLWDEIDGDNPKSYDDGEKNWKARAVSKIKGIIRRHT